MAKEETPEMVRDWFLRQVFDLWPAAEGSLSLRRNRCIRSRCSSCLSGEGHPSYALYLRQGRRRRVLYVSDDLVEPMSVALANGRKLSALLQEATERYLKALKAQKRRE